MSATGVAVPSRKPHWLWRLPAWLLATLVLDILLWMAVGTLDTWLLRRQAVNLPAGFSIAIPLMANVALAWKLGLVGWRSAAAIAGSLAVILLSLAQLFWSLYLLFPLDHILNGPH